MAKLPLLVAGRALAMVAALAALGAGAVDLARPPLAALMSTQGVAFDVALQALCAALLLAGWLWLQVAAAWLAVAAVARAARRPRLAAIADRLASRCTPTVLRRLVLAGCGVALSTGAVLPASAMTRAAPHGLAPDASDASASLPAPHLAGLPLPDRVDGPAWSWVSVRPGDSLWAITRRLLPADADDHAVAGACRRLVRANRTALGADPDLIHPGARLRVPDHLYGREPT